MMKTVPLTIRRCPATTHQALKKKAKENKRSLNAQVLEELETMGQTITWRIAGHLLKLNEKELNEFAAGVVQSIGLAKRRLKKPIS